MNQALRRLFFLSLAVCGACLANARVWTIDGKTKVEGEFTGIIGDIVFVGQADGTQLKFHLASLSAEDQAFIRKGEQATTSVVTSSTPPPSSGASGYAYADFSEPQPLDMAPGGSKPITFRRIVINIEPGTTIGTIYWEPAGEIAATMTAPPTISGTGQYATIVRDELQKAHYDQLGGENLIFDSDESAKARYELGAQVSALTLDAYIYAIYSTPSPNPSARGGPGVFTYAVSGPQSTSRQVKGHMTIDWQVYDTLTHKVAYTHTTNTGYKDYNGDGVAIFAMFRRSFRQLLSDSDFAAFMKPESTQEAKLDDGSSFGSALELTPFHPETARALPAGFSAILDSFVTIKSGVTTGAGFIITEDGYVLTAAHVVSGVKTVSVRLHSDLVLDAEVVRVDDGADVALIKLPGSSHKPIELAADDPSVGIDVYAIGDPTGEELSSSVAKGIVSGKREIDGHKYIQTDASVNPGNSGGPLIGKDGRAVGIISRKIVGVEYQGLAFAVPVTEAIAKLNLKFTSTAATAAR
jgi:serine protease Do